MSAEGVIVGLVLGIIVTLLTGSLIHINKVSNRITRELRRNGVTKFNARWHDFNLDVLFDDTDCDAVKVEKKGKEYILTKVDVEK